MNAEIFISGSPATASVEVAALSLLLAFGLSQLVAAVYIWTFRGMSYSKGLVHGMVVGGAIAATLMLAIGNSIAAGIGIAGGLSLIRFRTALRDPRDMMFVFAALGAGIASGLGAHEVAMLGTALFCVAAVTLTVTEFGGQRRYDGLLRFQLPADADEAAVTKLLRKYSRSVSLVTLRDVAQGAAIEHSYQIRLGDQKDRVALVRDLEGVPGIQDVSLLLQEPTVEI
jgi:hypothetical protein